MTDHIRIPIHHGAHGTTCAEITPDIARQIVALAFDNCQFDSGTVGMVSTWGKRIDALEKINRDNFAQLDAMRSRIQVENPALAETFARLLPLEMPDPSKPPPVTMPDFCAPVAADKPALSWGGVSGGCAGAGILWNAERPPVIGPGDDDYGRRKPFVLPDLTDDQKENLRKSLTEIRVQAQPVADQPAGDVHSQRIFVDDRCQYHGTIVLYLR